jgi:membrane-bound serine protease (ClpP class)
MKRILILSLFLFLIFLSLFFQSSSAIRDNDDKVLLIEIDGPIMGGSLEKVDKGIEKAEREGFSAVILAINTNGGRVDSLFSMVERIERSDLPIIGFVDGRAFSAGAMLLEGCDLACMASHSVIGSAHPVSISFSGSQPIEDEKTVNALAKYAESKALAHGRNGDVVKSFVTENLDLTSEEAMELGVIDFIAEDLEDLLDKVGGSEVKGKVLPEGLAKEEYNASFVTDILDILGDPTIASILLLVGAYALIFGLVSPGYGAEIVGSVCLILGLIGFGFDINYLALVLLAIGAILIILELFTPSFGVLGISGIITMALAGIFLIPLNYPDWYVSGAMINEMISSIIAVSLILGVFLIFALYKVIKARNKRAVFSTIEGEEAEAIDDLNPTGFVMYDGEYWRARSKNGEIKKGEKVIIIKKDGTELIVERKI